MCLPRSTWSHANYKEYSSKTNNFTFKAPSRRLHRTSSISPVKESSLRLYVGTGEMAHQLLGNTALIKDSSSGPGTHIRWWISTHITPDSGDLMPLLPSSWYFRHLQSHTLTHTRVYIYVYICIIKNEKGMTCGLGQAPEPELILRIHIKHKETGIWFYMLIIPVQGNHKQADPWGSLASQLLAEFH